MNKLGEWAKDKPDFIRSISLVLASGGGKLYDIFKPDECNEMTKSGGYGVTATQHFLGIDAGTVNINYEMYNIPDRMIVEYNGQEIAFTLGNVSGNGTLTFYFDGNPPYDYVITMIGDNTGTKWDYVAGCPK